MTHNYKKITRQFGVFYIFTILDYLFKPLLIFLLTRILSVSDFGVYSIFSSTISVLSSILILGLPSFIITKLPNYTYLKKIKSFISIIVFEAVFLIIILSILFIPTIQYNILPYLKLEKYQFEFQISMLIVLIATLFPLVASYLTANRKMEFQSFISFIYNCLWIILLVIFFLIFRKFNLTIVFVVWLVGIIISLIILLISLKKEIFFYFKRITNISFGVIKNALSFSIPLVPFIMSNWIITVADRYMINYFIDSKTTGIYSLSYSLVTIILSFSVIISHVLYPYIAKAWGEKKDYQILFNAMLKYSLTIILPGLIGLFVLREQIITLISGPEYLSGSYVIVILISFPLLASFIDIYTNSLLLQDKTKIIAGIYLLGAILNIILNLFLIPSYGIIGASIATVFSYIVMFIAIYSIAKKQLHWNFTFLRIKSIVGASIIMGIILAVINPQIYVTKILTIILGVVIYVILLFVFKVFVDKEYAIMHSLLPKSVQKILIKFIYYTGGR